MELIVDSVIVAQFERSKGTCRDVDSGIPLSKLCGLDRFSLGSSEKE